MNGYNTPPCRRRGIRSNAAGVTLGSTSQSLQTVRVKLSSGDRPLAGAFSSANKFPIHADLLLLNSNFMNFRVWFVIWIALIVVVVPWGTLDPHAHWDRMTWIPFATPVDFDDVIGNVM
jgi:hypothetical protein